MRVGALALLLAAPSNATPTPAGALHEGPRHALAMYGEPALEAGFDHLPSSNPNAPKGGRLTLAQDGSFDAMNPFIIKGNAPAAMVPYVVQPLMFRSPDEPFTVYGLLARTVETGPDRRWVEFRLDPAARFSDGTQVTAKDVAFSWALLRDHGRPAQRSAYAQVVSVTTPDTLTIRFDLTGSNYELPMILALMPVFAEHATDAARFEEPALTMPLGSGPYELASVDPGRSFVLRRRAAFWGKDLPVLRGLYNFDELKFDFYRDPNALFEAFKAGLYDIRVETSPVRWLTAYDFPAVREGNIVKEEVRFSVPKPFSAFIFNLRNPAFADIRVRKALGMMFDFEWVNANLFSGVFRRTDSIFPDSELSAAGIAADQRERALLAPFTTEIDPAILNGRYHPPRSDGSGRDRGQAHAALELLRAAGYGLRGGVLSDRSGVPFRFEIMATTREKQQLAAAYADSLKLIGIDARVRLVDSSQYWSRLRSFEYDVIVESYGNSASPGTEQINRWSSGAAGRDGSLNYAGVRSRAVDAMISALLAARDPTAFQAAAHALDRAVMSTFGFVPLFFAPRSWIAHRATVAHPESWARFSFTADNWWTQVR